LQPQLGRMTPTTRARRFASSTRCVCPAGLRFSRGSAEEPRRLSRPRPDFAPVPEVAGRSIWADFGECVSQNPCFIKPHGSARGFREAGALAKVAARKRTSTFEADGTLS
jgi:hypothetical protein